MVFVAIQVRQFNVIRDDEMRPSFMDNEKILKMERHIESLEKRLNDTSDTMHSKTDEIEDKLESTQQRIQQNTDEIVQQQEYEDSVHRKLSEMERTIEPSDDMVNIMEFWEAMSRTNWISEIHDKPSSVRYGLVEYGLAEYDAAGNGPDNGGGGGLGVFGAIQSGAGLWVEEQRRGFDELSNQKKDDLGVTANRNIEDEDEDEDHRMEIQLMHKRALTSQMSRNAERSK